MRSTHKYITCFYLHFLSISRAKHHLNFVTFRCKTTLDIRCPTDMRCVQLTSQLPASYYVSLFLRAENHIHVVNSRKRWCCFLSSRGINYLSPTLSHETGLVLALWYRSHISPSGLDPWELATDVLPKHKKYVVISAIL